MDQPTIETKKSELIQKIKDCMILKNKYYLKMCKYEKIDSNLNVVTLGFSTVGSTLILSALPVLNPIVMIIGASFSATSAIIGSVQRGMLTKIKYDSFRNTYLQLQALASDYSAKIIHNHLSSIEYDNLIEMYNDNFHLILESSLPI
jgi:hypothetical protein